MPITAFSTSFRKLKRRVGIFQDVSETDNLNLTLRYLPSNLLNGYQALEDFPCALEHLQCCQILRLLD